MINIENLSFSYNRETLFSNLNLTLAPGGICGLLGKNGAGKTTLLKLMGGLRFPQEGIVRINGREPSKRSVDFLQDLFFLPEVFDLPPVTPRQYEKLYSPFYPGFRKNRFSEYLCGFEVSDSKRLNLISHGQKKKFLIAFGLATRCCLILMDEPTNGLDIPSKSQFRKFVASCLSEDQVFIIATHQVRDLENLIDPVIILDKGRVILNQSLGDIFDRLKVTHQNEPPDVEKILYSEKRLDGYVVVTESDDGGAAGIDLETLFNTAVSNQSDISRMFRNGENQ